MCLTACIYLHFINIREKYSLSLKVWPNNKLLSKLQNLIFYPLKLLKEKKISILLLKMTIFNKNIDSF